MNVEAVVQILLSSASEDELGLFEAIWELNAKFPDEPLGRKYDLASEALTDLHKRGWIRFRKITMTQGKRQVEQISAPDVGAMLRNPVSWYPEYDGAQIVFVCTEAGISEYMGKPGY